MTPTPSLGKVEASRNVLALGSDGRPLGLKVQVVKPGLPGTYEGILEHFIPGEASLLLDHNFPQDTLVRVNIHGFEFDGHVVFCERKGDFFDAHIVIPEDEVVRRRGPRYVVELPARAYTSLSHQPMDAKIVDISKDGLGLECPSNLSVGETLAVESQSNLAFGIVRHCRPLPAGGYRVGLQVHNVIIKEGKPADLPAKKSWVRSLFAGHPDSHNSTGTVSH